MHTLVLFTRSRLERREFFFLKIEFLDSLQELVLKKICRKVFS